MDGAENSMRLPTFPQELIEACRQSGDYRPMLFEWYKHVAVVCNHFASIKRNSPAFRELPSVHYAVLIGLLNRCSRLMLGNVALSSNALFGETTSVIDRCILESAIKVQWLCQSDQSERFERFLADGIKRDHHLRRHIEANIERRGGDRYVIENRMLRSMDRVLDLSGLSETRALETKRLPNLSSIMSTLGMGDGMYIAIQRMGSHAVHGTWKALVTHYLQVGDGEFKPRDHDVPTHHNQYVIVMLMVLEALGTFLKFMTADSTDPEIGKLSGYLDEMINDVLELDKEDHGSDFTVA